MEGRGPQTELWRLLETRRPERARLRLLELNRGAPSSIAELAPRVIRASRRGDGPALSIVCAAITDLALLCSSVLKRGEFDDKPEIRACGGLFKSRWFYELFAERIGGALEGARTAHSERTPAYGAALLALEELGFVRFGRLS